jgi:hypothetical protein
VFIDETWIKTNMARTHARAPCGQRAIGAVPHGHWQTSTFLAALRCDRLTAPCVIDGPTVSLRKSNATPSITIFPEPLPLRVTVEPTATV